MQIELSEVQKAIADVMAGFKARLVGIGSNKVALAYVNAGIEVCERLLIFLNDANKKGEIDMAKVPLEFSRETVRLDEILADRHRGVIEPKILEIAKKLKPGDAQPVNAESIKYTHFAARVYSMVDKGLLTDNVGPVKVGESFYLAKYTDEQMKLRRKRREKTAK